MIRVSFNAGWKVRPKLGMLEALRTGVVGWSAVTLPHDAVRDQHRSADCEEGSHTGYFPGGCFEYTKDFNVPADYREKTVLFEFEGVYRDATVYINDEYAAQRPYGYSGFHIKADPYLKYGETNVLRVEARMHKDTRWYSGAGIYRNTKLILADPVHVALDGVRVTTRDIDVDQAVVEVVTEIENEHRSTRTIRLDTRVVDPAGETMAAGTTPVTLLPDSRGVSRARFVFPSPELWSPDSPALYAVHTTVRDGADVLDQEFTRFGIRRLQLDTRHGLRLNGEAIKLRGACIHHDNGPLGSTTVERAEERRVEILKAAGFNAIRSAHNPASKAILDACDRIGMLVIDELSDVWTKPKSPFDYSLAFPEWWERDTEAMVAKDFNHPSVIMYSTGNEIQGLGTPIQSVWCRKVAEKIRGLDPTRLVTNAINPSVAVGSHLEELAAERPRDIADVNEMMSSIGDIMARFAASEVVTQAIEEAAGVLDVVGLNYADTRYELDREVASQRVLLGSETFPARIDELWRTVGEHSHVIGDFTWTGWDYLGESGIGRIAYTDEPGYVPTGTVGPFPYLTASTGDIDITGFRRPVSYYRETVFGLRHRPYIAVHRPQFHGRPMSASPWAWTDSVSSWSWDVTNGSPTIVDVYSDAEEVELLLNGSPVGRATVGTERAFLARFELPYEPGELVAVCYRGGHEQARTALRTAEGTIRLVAVADRAAIRADDTDLAYISITLEDEVGNLANHRDRAVAVEVSGAGILAGLGTGRPDPGESFAADRCTTFDGRALAVIRPVEAGEITVMIRAESCEPVRVDVASTVPMEPR